MPQSPLRREAQHPIGRGAAPVWCNPRRRYETGRHTRAYIEAGTRRTQVRWSPTHGYQPDQPSCLTGSAPSDGQDKLGRRCERQNCRRLLTPEVISMPKLQRRGLTHHRLPPVPPRRKPPLSPRPLQAVVRRRSGRPCVLGFYHHPECSPYDACNKACVTSWGNSIKMK
jgi:hypothetical protein